MNKDLRDGVQELIGSACESSRAKGLILSGAIEDLLDLVEFAYREGWRDGGEFGALENGCDQGWNASTTKQRLEQ